MKILVAAIAAVFAAFPAYAKVHHHAHAHSTAPHYSISGRTGPGSGTAPGWPHKGPVQRQ
jgi:hypothetical protein